MKKSLGLILSESFRDALQRQDRLLPARMLLLKQKSSPDTSVSGYSRTTRSQVVWKTDDRAYNCLTLTQRRKLLIISPMFNFRAVEAEERTPEKMSSLQPPEPQLDFSITSYEMLPVSPQTLNIIWWWHQSPCWQHQQFCGISCSGCKNILKDIHFMVLWLRIWTFPTQMCGFLITSVLSLKSSPCSSNMFYDQPEERCKKTHASTPTKWPERFLELQTLT